MKNSIEWLLDRIEDVDNTPKIWEQIKIQAKKMHRKELGKTWDAALDKYEVRAGNYMRAYEDFDDYYDETYGSKGSDEDNLVEIPTSSQKEISDSTITDQIDGIIFNLPFDEKIKLWELIDKLVLENKTEISDVEIKEFTSNKSIFADDISLAFFILGAKWYREQLKQKI